MRYSKLFGKTRHNPPCDSDSKNALFLTQAGFVEKLAAGIYNYLPLGYKVFSKVCKIIREEMNKVEGQEILMPTLHPIEIWEKTGRDKTMNEILFRTKGSGDKDFVLGPSHEETVTPLVGNYIQSYKDLPLSVYQIQTKFRNEPRAKSGILRGREFGMKDMYSFHTDEKDLDEYYEKVKEAYLNVYKRCGLEAYVIEASGGPFSDKLSHEFSVVTPSGEDIIILCPKCKTAQNIEVAVGKIKDPDAKEEKELPLKLIDIERAASVKANAIAHNVPEHKILKSVVYEIIGEGLIGVVIRGDLNVNENKLMRYLKKPIHPASAEMLKEMGLVPGYISPVNMPKKINISFIGDHSIKNVKNFVTGANEYAKDYANANIGRDFIISDFVDLVEIRSGFECHNCGGKVEELKAVEAGNIFKLGTKYSKIFGVNYTDKDGKNNDVVMGCYGIGTTRLVGTIVEASHDENGIIWPISVAPYPVHLVSLGNDENVIKMAEKLHDDFLKDGVDVLFDDRNVSAGVKFKDADLIGNPIRIVVSKKTLEADSVEFKLRKEKESEMVKIKDLKNKISKLLSNN
ncbi:MAG: proline--tRNA ligase [Candidatus Gracilibacteria bacterium]|jgi:prolyl-tRNA synthetase